jgi:thiamine-phosphate pyrophosphorylase
MKKYIEKLHFITHDLAHSSHIEQVQVACEAGAKWIQYRCLSKADDELLADINLIAEICDDWGATLIVTNHIHLRGKADIQGFHLEDMDADFIALRKQIGEEFTLGGSANTIEQLIKLANDGADYAGYGPFNITSIKPNNYSLISIDEYANAVEKLKSANLDLPILAVGGVTIADVSALMATGIFGIVASSAINQAENMYEAYVDFYRAVN